MDETHGEHPRVLVVDDHDLVRRAIASALSSFAVVTTAAHGGEAMEMLEAGLEFDVVLLDMCMPILDGFGVLEALQSSSHPALERVVVLSAGLTAAQEAWLDAHGVAWTPKPLSRAVLQALVHAAAERAR